MDLLTVVTHELGHILGLPDVSATFLPNDLMDTTLPTGTAPLADAGRHASARNRPAGSYHGLGACRFGSNACRGGDVNHFSRPACRHRVARHRPSAAQIGIPSSD